MAVRFAAFDPGEPTLERATGAWILPLGLLLAVACVQWQLARFREPALRFWQSVRLALLAWLLFELGAAFWAGRGVEARGAAAACLAALFAALMLALDGRPHLAAPQVALTHALERVGSVVFAFGLLLYATVDEGYELGLRCLSLLFLLYLFARLLHRSRMLPGQSWRSSYLLLAQGALLAACSVAGPLVFGGGGALWPLLALGAPAASVAALLRSGPGAGAAGPDDADSEEPLSPRPEPLAQLWSGPLTAYAIAFPALHLAGYALGLLDPSLLAARSVLTLVLLLALGGTALWQQKELQNQAEEARRRHERASQYDALTGLASRVSFVERVGRSLSRAKRVQGYQFAVLAVELERFKLIENAYGPRFARDIVVGLAARLKQCLRPADMVAALGPDRFAVLADHIRPGHAARDLSALAQRIGGSVLSPSFSAHPETSQADLAAEIAERILRDAVSPPIAVDQREVYPRGSIGIATSNPQYADADEMLRDALAAARRAKLRGGDTFEMFDPDMQAESLARVVVESELHRAVERGELLLVYQPLMRVRADDAELVGFEALLRWRHPTRGLLRPFEFLAAADSTGLMVPMTRWVLGEACRRAAEWQRAAGRPIFVTCNVGGPQFQPGRGLHDAVADALRESGLPGSQLKLEITEGVAIASFDTVRDEIESLKGLGIDFLLDDFGTGYSSLSYLHRLPVKGIKIDRSFIESLPHDPGATALVRGIVELARELERDVIAEGIETLEQLQSVRALGCGYGQGYFFGHPAEPSDLAKLLEAPGQ